MAGDTTEIDAEEERYRKATGPIIQQAVIPTNAPALPVSEKVENAPQYDSPKDRPPANAKQVSGALAERERIEALVTLNQGRRVGGNPKFHFPTQQNPNAKWDPTTKKFIPGSGFYDIPQRPIPPTK